MKNWTALLLALVLMTGCAHEYRNTLDIDTFADKITRMSKNGEWSIESREVDHINNSGYGSKNTKQRIVWVISKEMSKIQLTVFGINGNVEYYESFLISGRTNDLRRFNSEVDSILEMPVGGSK